MPLGATVKPGIQMGISMTEDGTMEAPSLGRTPTLGILVPNQPCAEPHDSGSGTLWRRIDLKAKRSAVLSTGSWARVAPELLVTGRTGLIVPANDPEALMTAIGRHFPDRHLARPAEGRRRLGTPPPRPKVLARARDRIQAEFSATPERYFS